MKEGVLPAHPDPDRKETRRVSGTLVSKTSSHLHIKLGSGVQFKVPRSEVDKFAEKDGLINAHINEAWLSSNCIGS